MKDEIVKVDMSHLELDDFTSVVWGEDGPSVSIDISQAKVTRGVENLSPEEQEQFRTIQARRNLANGTEAGTE